MLENELMNLESLDYGVTWGGKQHLTVFTEVEYLTVKPDELPLFVLILQFGVVEKFFHFATG